MRENKKVLEETTKMKSFKKMISFLLCAALLLSTAALTPLSAFAVESNTPSTAPSISLGEKQTAEINKPGEYVYFAFTPDKSLVYEFTAFSDSDTYGYIYDSTLNTLAYDDDNGEGMNFRAVAYLTAGETYYLGAKFYSSIRIGSFDVVIRVFDGVAEGIYENTIYVPYGESTVLTANALSNSDSLTYHWFDNDVEISGAASDSLTVNNVVTRRVYSCTVADSNGNYAYFSFTVRVDSGLSAEHVGDSSRYVQPYGSDTLSVNASVNLGTLHYKWFYSYEEIPGETDSSLRLENLTQRRNYYCEVSDDYGNYENVYFYIYIDNGFSANAVGETSVYVAPAESASLSVSEQHDQGNVYYQWAYYGVVIDDYNGVEYNDWIYIENAAGSSYVTPAISEYTEYRCYVSDDFGNYNNIYFYVGIDNAFSANAKEKNDVEVAPGASAVLEIEASCKTGKITYQWYAYGRYTEESGEEVYGWHPIDGASASSYQTPAISEYSKFYCVVQDEYANREDIYFYVSVNNGLIADNVGGSSRYVAPGGSETLSVSASVLAGDIHYQWYKEYRYINDNGGYSWRNDMLPNETESTLTIENITSPAEYYCTVSDDYGNSRTVWFYVYIDSGFSAERIGEDSRYVQPGADETLGVNASVNIGNLHYQWYKEYKVYYEDGDYYWTTDVLPGETSSSLSVKNITSPANYYCNVTDDYGNNSNIWFYIHIDSGLIVNTQDSDLYVKAGERTTISVDASVNSGELHYSWRAYVNVYDEEYGYWNRELIYIDAADNTIATFEINSYSEYCCEVSDDYGNSESVWFNIYVDSGFNVKTKNTTIDIAPGESKTLSVEASVDQGELHYRWSGYKYFYDEEYGYWDWEDFSIDEAGSSVTTGEITSRTEYVCHVSDDYGNGETVYFEIYIENGFNVNTPEENWLEAGSGAKVTLSVDASANSELTYSWGTWNYFEDYSAFENANGPEFTTPELTEYTEIWCRITDVYGTTSHVYFYIDIDTNIVHEYGEPTWSWGADNKTASVTFVCKNEENHSEIVIAKITSKSTAANCTKDGKTDYTATVTFEGKTYTNTKTTAGAKATGHKWNSGKVTTAATDTKEGVKTYTCTVCGETKTESIPKTASPAISSDNVQEKDGAVYAYPNLTASDVLKAAGTGAKILKTDGSQLKSSEKVGSGMTLVKADGTKATIIINGDNTGDGEITASDARFALRTAVNLEKPNSWQKNASLVDSSKAEITASDARLILRAAVNLETLNLY